MQSAKGTVVVRGREGHGIGPEPSNLLPSSILMPRLALFHSRWKLNGVLVSLDIECASRNFGLECFDGEKRKCNALWSR